MIVEIRIPSPGESISEVEMATWMVSDGDYVEKDQEVGEIESDKATLPLIAESSGKISIKTEEGQTVNVGDIACTIDTDAKGNVSAKPEKEKEEESVSVVEKKESAPIEKPTEKAKQSKPAEHNNVKVTPVAQKLMQENDLNIDDIINGLKRISKKEVHAVISNNGSPEAVGISAKESVGTRDEERQAMSSLRKKLSQRLVSVKNETAMLTTFNEVNMNKVIELRKKYQKVFVEKHGIKLGFMSFFTKAVVEALKVYPKVNSQIDGNDIVTPSYYDIGIAVQTDKGLMVPVLRNAETMGLADIENQIATVAKKARAFRLSIDEMTGGTFTITNGGIFGSLLSTPILNPPQSAILGMHNIVERPIAVNGKVEIHPMMYIALSYDHRMIDGKDSVSFLVKIKELIEDPQKMLFKGENPEKLLLEI